MRKKRTEKQPENIESQQNFRKSPKKPVRHLVRRRVFRLRTVFAFFKEWSHISGKRYGQNRFALFFAKVAYGFVMAALPGGKVSSFEICFVSSYNE